MKPVSLTLITAATSSNGIGVASTLPWRLSKEMNYFAQVTTTLAAEGDSLNAVIMGRKSWEGIPTKFRPLKGRLNIIISRQADYDIHCTASQLAASLPAAISLLSTLPSPPSKVFMIGGAQLYSHSLSVPDPSFVADRILLTRIKSPGFENCDAFFPEFRSAATLGRGDDGIVVDRVAGEWKRSSHEELEKFVGFEVVRGDQVEKDVTYEFQMWTR